MNPQYMSPGQGGGGYGAHQGYTGQGGYGNPQQPPPTSPQAPQSYPGMPTKGNMPSPMGMPPLNQYPGQQGLPPSNGPLYQQSGPQTPKPSYPMPGQSMQGPPVATVQPMQGPPGQPMQKSPMQGPPSNAVPPMQGQQSQGPPSNIVQPMQGPPHAQQPQGLPPNAGQPMQGPPYGQQSQGPPLNSSQPRQGPPSSVGQPMQGPPHGQQSQGPPLNSSQPMQGPPSSVGQPMQGPPHGQQSQGPPLNSSQPMQGPPSSVSQPMQGPPHGQPLQGPPHGQQSQGPPLNPIQPMQGPPSSVGQPMQGQQLQGPSLNSSQPMQGPPQGPPPNAGQPMQGPPRPPSQMIPPMPGRPPSSQGPQGPNSQQMYPSPGGPQQQGRLPPGQPPTAQLTNHMAGMSINGHPSPPLHSQQSPQGGYPGSTLGGPPLSGPPPPGGGYGPPRYSTVNGAPPGEVNGLSDPTSPGRPPQAHRYPPMPQQQTGGYMTGSHPQQPGPQPGYPSQPSYPSQQSYPPQPGYPTHPGYPGDSTPQQSRRLDPDQMPSPMQVMFDDQKTRSGVFYTNQKGQVPPLVTTDFIVQDQGNVSPRFMRSTMYNIPISSDIVKQTGVPFGLVISPMADVLEEEQPPPLVDFGELGPVRCIRCKAYMSPNMQFIDGGRRFHCLLCKATTDVPAEYFQHLDHTGLRVDRFERAELVLGAYDIIATKEYCRDNQYPKPPALIFVIDVSYNNVKSGLVALLCSSMRNILENLPKETTQDLKSPMRVGFITYNNSVHFYNLSPMLGQPQMLVVGDTQEVFMPLLDGFLVDVEESAALIDALMLQIPAMFADTRETETILAPAIQAGLEALKASGCAGKLLVFHSSLPIAEAPGKLKNRDDRSLLGTDKEKTILTPQNQVYNNLGQDCVGAGVSVDLFITNNSFIDLATIGQVSRLTGGEIYKYTYFQAEFDGDRLISDVEKDVARLCAFDAIMRVRTSTGIRPTDFYGHFFMSNTTDIELASIDPDKGIAIEIKHDDKLCEEEGVYIQAALLFTSLNGQRRIRVLNLVLKACSQMSELYRTCELDTLINFFSKQSVYKLLESSPKAVKDGLIVRSAQILACYRKNCASPTSAGQLILPECMKLLPLYVNCLLKNDAVSGGKDMTVDDRWFMMAAVMIMDIPSSLIYFYPRLYPLHELQDDLLPPPIRCSSEKMSDNGVYLLENGIYMFLWLGLAVPSEWVMSVFGVPSTAQVDIDKNRLPHLDNPISNRLRSVISNLSSTSHRSMRLTIVRQRDKMELVMKHFLVEDQRMDGAASYVDFLCHLHKEIRNILS